MMGEATERSTQQGAERLRQHQRAVGDERVETTTTGQDSVVAIDARKVVGFPGTHRSSGRARRR